MLGYALYPGILTQSRTAAAAFDIALCENYKNFVHCQLESIEIGVEVVYFIMEVQL
jgi:hypothetical protein